MSCDLISFVESKANMECNEDEASKAMKIAYEKIAEKDYNEARTFASKANDLNPNLKGLPLLLKTIEVYVSAEQKINGDVDWYKVLGVEPLADDATIRQSYRELALILHPDKHKSVGAEGAFQIVSQAWSVLCDKSGRLAYDLQRNYLLQKDRRVPSPPLLRHKVKSSTFWATCKCCKLLLEYPSKKLNKCIRCVRCRNFFYAWADQQSDIPSDLSNTTSSSTDVHGRKSSMQNTTNKCSLADGVVTGNVQATLASSTAQPSTRFWENYAGYMREATMREVALNETRAANETDSGLAAQASVAATGSVVKTNKQKRTRVSNIEKENLGTNSGIQAFLATVAKHHIQKNVNKWRMAEPHSKVLVNSNVGPTQGIPNSNVGPEKPIPKNEEVKKQLKSNDIVLAVSALFHRDVVNLVPKVKDTMAMTVPDGDFHNFDSERTAISFAENEVWAVYDCDDAMPRLYAMIRKVVSVAPFKLKISWLKAKGTTEFGSLKWINAGFIKTIGDLRASKSETNTSLNSFSHKVQWAKAARGPIQIYPKKGDVWALYKNWSCDWNTLTPVEVIRKYEMVEVVEDYTKEKGATVVPLVKVAGFKTVFRQLLGPNTTRVIPREEMFRFSHQVPSYLLKGHEGDNVPKDCLELDPASLPVELLQVSTEAQVDETEKTAAEKDETEAEKTNGQEAETTGLRVYKRRRLGTSPVEAGSSATSNEDP